MGDLDWQKKPADDGRKPSTHARRYVDAYVAHLLEKAIDEQDHGLFMERREDGSGYIVDEPTRRRRLEAARRMLAKLRTTKVTP
jgi:hypothetical protein